MKEQEHDQTCCVIGDLCAGSPAAAPRKNTEMKMTVETKEFEVCWEAVTAQLWHTFEID